jgi:hypothetical protein
MTNSKNEADETENEKDGTDEGETKKLGVEKKLEKEEAKRL